MYDEEKDFGREAVITMYGPKITNIDCRKPNDIGEYETLFAADADDFDITQMKQEQIVDGQLAHAVAHMITFYKETNGHI